MDDDAPAPAPAATRFRAPAHWRSIEFFSDLHLAPQTPRTFDAFARHLARSEADAIVILGQIFEVWVGDDARFEPFEQACLQALRDAASRRYLAFIAGNRDFLVGTEFLADAGMHGWHDPTLLEAFGSCMLLTHGDALCLSDTAYQQFRRMVRAAPWQQGFLAQPLAERQEQARRMRAASEHGRSAETVYGDIDEPAALSWLQAGASRTLVHGHTHRPSHDRLGTAGCERWVLSDWDFEAVPPRADVLRWSASGIERAAPLG